MDAPALQHHIDDPLQWLRTTLELDQAIDKLQQFATTHYNAGSVGPYPGRIVSYIKFVVAIFAIVLVVFLSFLAWLLFCLLAWLLSWLLSILRYVTSVWTHDSLRMAAGWQYCQRFIAFIRNNTQSLLHVRRGVRVTNGAASAMIAIFVFWSWALWKMFQGNSVGTIQASPLDRPVLPSTLPGGIRVLTESMYDKSEEGIVAEASMTPAVITVPLDRKYDEGEEGIVAEGCFLLQEVRTLTAELIHPKMLYDFAVIRKDTSPINPWEEFSNSCLESGNKLIAAGPGKDARQIPDKDYQRTFERVRLFLQQDQSATPFRRIFLVDKEGEVGTEAVRKWALKLCDNYWEK